MGTKDGWKSIEFKTGFIGMNYYALPTHIISPETWEMMINFVNKKMEEE